VGVVWWWRGVVFVYCCCTEHLMMGIGFGSVRERCTAES
jgi:hypothetical protein